MKKICDKYFEWLLARSPILGGIHVFVASFVTSLVIVSPLLFFYH